MLKNASLWAMRIPALLAVSCIAIACAEKPSPATGETDIGGTLVIAMPADPGAIFPPFAFTSHARMIASQIYDHLADVGPDMNTIGDKGFQPQLAERWTWAADSLSIAFHINPRARWHDGRAVTARDVKFTHALYGNPDLGGQTSEAHARIDSVTAPDSLTVVYWFSNRSPTQFLDAAAQVQILPAHILDSIPVKSLRESNPPIIGSGRFRLKRWDKGASGELVADSGNHRGRAKLDRVIWSVSSGSTTSTTRLFTGAADIFDGMRPEDVREAARNADVRVVAVPALDYAFLQFNLRDRAGSNRPHPLFAERELRRAIAMSVDRAQVVRSILDTFASVAVGPTARAYPTTDSLVTQLPYDTARARRTLDSLGWTSRDARGIRRRGDQLLAFTSIVPSPSGRMRAAVIVQEQLRRAGIQMDIEQMDAPAFSQRWSSRKFDAAFGTFNMSSTPGATLRLWGTSGIPPNGYNFGSYSNPTFDAAADSALKATDPARARELFSRAYRTINDDAAAIWLYEPKALIGMHKRIKPVNLRRGAWWFDLGNWSIPRAERLPRDESSAGR